MADPTAVDLVAARSALAMSSIERREDWIPEARSRLDALVVSLERVDDNRARLQLGDTLVERASLRRDLNDWRGALDDVRRALAIAAVLKPFARRALEHSSLFLEAQILAADASEVRDPAAAEECVARLRTIGAKGFALDDLAVSIASTRGDWDEVARRSLALAQRLDVERWPEGAAAARTRAGKALLELGEAERARDVLRAAVSELEAQRAEDRLPSARLPLARALSALGEHDAAWTLAIEALRGGERRMHRLRALADQQRFMADKRKDYAALFRIALARGGREGVLRAWAAAERAKSLSLRFLLATAGVAPGGESARAARRAEAEHRLDAAEAALARATREGRDASELAPLEHAMRDAAAEAERLDEDRMRAIPRWAALREPPELDVEAALGALAGWSVLSFHWERDDGGGARLHVFHLDARGEPAEATSQWSAAELARLEAARAALVGTVDIFAPLIPDDLAAKVLSPSVVATWRRERPLLVSAHGALVGMPLHAFALADGALVIDRVAVQYIPTLSLLALDADRARAALPDAARALVVGCERDGFGDPPLPDVPAEVDALARVWEAARPGRADAHLIASDERPEERALPADAWDRFDVLHFACHGDFPEGRPLDAGLRLGAGVLRAREFFGLRLRARLVALSACAVGRQARRAFGLDLGDDEWIGLYLPLFYAGARSLVASQWNANSEQAVPFMTALHEALARGAPPVEAYAAGISAVRHVPEQLWANWVLVGVPDARAAPPDDDAESDR